MHPILVALTQAIAAPGDGGTVDSTPGAGARRGEPAPAWVEGALPLEALAVEVGGTGRLGQPLLTDQSEALHALSRPARFGRRDKTLLDTRVRHTGEIDADAVSLAWAPGAFQDLQSAVARGLGLPAVQASLHKLLVYGTGQFFKPHQDTEKQPGMVATLVLVWPSAHIGGGLQLSRHERSGRFESQQLRAPALRWLAFYADCRHEVLPVTEGWRVVLTFDVMLSPAVAPVRPPPHPALVAALRQAFFDPVGPRRAPWVLLLDHQYTEHGLRWSLLKAEDRQHAPALRAAAEALGLEVHLALAEVHELWSAGAPRRNRRGVPQAPDRDELIDEDVGLDFWVGADDQPVQRTSLRLSLREVQAFVPTDEAFLVDQAYEGYMGNYGETLDYWYRRAAVVLQSDIGIEADRFDNDFDAALADAVALARRPGSHAVLAQRLTLAADALHRQLARRGRTLWPAYAELAMACSDVDQAQALIAPMPWAQLLPEDAPLLAALARRWGAPWLLAWWRGSARPHMVFGGAWGADIGKTPAGLPWPSPLPAWVRALQQAGLGEELLIEACRLAWAAVQAADRSLASRSPAARQSTLSMRLDAVAELLGALQLWPSASAGRADQGAGSAQRLLLELIGQIRNLPQLYPPVAWRPLVEALAPSLARLPAARELRERAVLALRQALAAPLPADDDARLDPADWLCQCRDCVPVRHWLASAEGRPLVMAMAENRRRHVTEQAGISGLPVSTDTLKEGSPYKLRLGKPADLPMRRRALRAGWADDLAVLTVR